MHIGKERTNNRRSLKVFDDAEVRHAFRRTINVCLFRPIV